jgi:hypothetical protein
VGELVASIRRRPSRYSARVIVTVPAAGAVTVNVAVLVTPPAAAVIVAVRLAVTDVVVTWKLPLETPAGIVIDAGTDAAASELDSATVKPPPGAGAVSTTVAVDPWPPATVDGDSETPAQRCRRRACRSSA